jgi:hypothetical protein
MLNGTQGGVAHDAHLVAYLPICVPLIMHILRQETELHKVIFGYLWGPGLPGNALAQGASLSSEARRGFTLQQNGVGLCQAIGEL